MSDLRSVYFITLIPAMWCFLAWLMSRLSGWSRLAQHYRSPRNINGESARMRSGRIGVVNYHSLLSLRVNDDGLRIAVALPLRLGHPPLFIPWNQFHQIAEDPIMYSHKIKASVGQPTLVRMTLPGWVKYRMPLDMRPSNSTTPARP
jgi:hypothetical protein